MYYRPVRCSNRRRTSIKQNVPAVPAYLPLRRFLNHLIRNSRSQGPVLRQNEACDGISRRRCFSYHPDPVGHKLLVPPTVTVVLLVPKKSQLEAVWEAPKKVTGMPPPMPALPRYQPFRRYPARPARSRPRFQAMGWREVFSLQFAPRTSVDGHGPGRRNVGKFHGQHAGHGSVFNQACHANRQRICAISRRRRA